jgi:hypothetical protein
MYAAFDLHATKTYLAIIDGEGVPVFKRKLCHEREILRSALGPYEEGIEGVVAESTFN